MFVAGSFFSQNFSVGGSIKDASNGETIIGATILLKEANKAAFTNQYGFFSISAPKGKYTLIISYIGYKTITQELDLDKNTTLNISFSPSETNYNR